MSIITGDNTPNTLNGTASDDSISGLAAIDQLNGLAGNDTLTGGTGDDTLTGGEGVDSYVFNLGDGQDTINNQQTVAAADKIIFGTGITLANVRLNKEGNDLVITFTNSPNDSIRIQSQFFDSSFVLSTLQFSDASTLSIAPTTLTNTLYLTGGLTGETLTGYDGKDIVSGNAGADTISGLGGDDSLDGGTGADVIDGGGGLDTLIGGTGNDALLGGDGNDLLTGGIGDDSLTGGEGADSYVFNLGDGNDTISNLQSTANADKIVLGAGITAANLRLYREGNDLVVYFINSSDDSIRIQGQFSDPQAVLPTIQFSDSSTLSINPASFAGTLYGKGGEDGDNLPGFAGGDYIWAYGGNDNLSGLAGYDHLEGGAGADYLDGGADGDYLLGGSGNDTLIGGADIDQLVGGSGDDQMSGGEGTDYYDYYLSDGDDTINNQQVSAASDVLLLGPGITAANIVLNRQGNDLLITFSNSSHDSIRIVGQFYDPTYQLHTLQFNDATTMDISPAALTGRTVYSTGYFYGEYAEGTVGNDVMQGNGGSDTLLGMSGNDSLLGGAGEDYLSSDTGDDTLAGGSGDDILIGGEGVDRYLYSLGDGNDAIVNSQTIAANDQIVFAAGITAANLLFSRVSYDLIIGFSNSSTDSIRIANYFSSSLDQLNTLTFSDNSTLAVDQALLTAPLLENDTDTGNVMNGLGGNDTINGNGGGDQIYGNAGNDSLDGGSGSDVIVGSDGEDILLGGSGNDVLLGFDGYDTLIGGRGDDSLSGGEHNDNYYFNVGDGQDTINNYQDIISSGSSTDRLQLGAGFSAANLQFRVDGNDLVILFSNSSGDIIHVFNQFAGSVNYQLQTVQFSNGTLQALPTVATGLTSYVVGNNGNDTFTGGSGSETSQTGAGADLLRGNGGGDTLQGGDGNDSIYGGDYHDLLTGGRGDDVLEGNEGSDSYVFNLGDGNDTITNDQVVLANDQIVFGAGISTANLIYSRVGDDLIITLSNSADDSIRVRNQFTTSSPLRFILLNDGTNLNTPAAGDLGIVYSNGTSSADTLNGYDGLDVMSGLAGADSISAAGGNDTLSGGSGIDTLLGGAGNDWINGGTGDDSLQGGDGDDNYQFNLGDGNDILNNLTSVVAADQIVFGAGILAANIVLNRSGNDLLISFNNTPSDSIRVLNQFSDPSSVLGTLRFSDASTLSLTSLSNTLYSTGYDYNADTLDGFDGTDVISGLGGADLAHGMAGNDNINGGYGNDRLFGGDGLDTLSGGAGDDFLQGDDGADSYLYALGDGDDTINNLATTAAADKLIFAAGISVGNIHLTRDEGDLIITLTNSISDSIRIQNQFANPAAVLSTLQFSDTSTLSIDPNALTYNLTSTGGAGGDLLLGVTSADVMYGNGGNDFLQGYAGNDFLSGGTGGDYLDGGADNDNLWGDNGNDVLLGEDGVDGLKGGLGDDTLNGGEGADIYDYTLGSGQDVINNQQSVAADDRIFLGAGISLTNLRLNREANDLVLTFTDSANDSIRILNQFSDPTYQLNTLQFSDNSTLSINPTTLTNTLYSTGGSAADYLNGYNGSDVMSGNNGADVLNGLEGADTLLGGAGQDTLNGSNGNDLLDGGIGADLMSGGGGDDSFVVDNAYDQIVENANEGTDSVQSSVSHTLSANVENLTLTGTGSTTGIGNSSSNVITGNSGNNGLNGGSGADTMIGGAGNDTYTVDNSFDVVTEAAGGGTDSVHSALSYTLGANLENLTLIGSGNTNATGNSLANVIVGNGGNNTLNGGSGADSMSGGAGSDLYIVDNAGDVVTEAVSIGNDSVHASVSYTLTANVENLQLLGLSSLNATGNSLANTLTGNISNNVLDGSTGADTMIGGLGNDSYVIDDAGDLVTENAAEGTDTVQSALSYTLTANVEKLIITGTGTRNGVGNSLNNVLTGNSGNNILNGSTGADTMIGGLGDDTYIIDDSGDVVTENAASGTDTVQSALSYTLGANLENLTLTGTGTRNGVGNSLANVLTGNSGNNTLNGSTGADTLIGGAGNDSYIVDDAGDVVIENLGEGTDSVQTALSYTLTENVENLTITGTGTRNGVGNSLNNVLTGNAGNNSLNGAMGTDTLIGGLGNDTYTIDIAGDLVQEAAGEGTDTVSSSISYTLTANVENLTLTGTGTRNGVGNDLANYFVGNAGNNMLTGGKGSDTYNLGRTSLHDTLVESDSTVGNTDTLRFAADVHYDQLWFKQVGNDLIVDIIGTANSATIKNFYFSSANHIEVFRSGDGKVLTDARVQNLVNAMASMTEPGTGQTTLTPAQASSLAPVFTANWT